MLIKVIKDGQKNVSVLVKGILTDDIGPVPVVDISQMQAPATGWKGLRLDSAVWAIQEKLGFNLWWNKPEGEEDLIFPMESRNGMRFDEGVPSPRVAAGWRGIMYLSSFRAREIPGPKSYAILLDFDKQ